jgi:hypothetical protein
VHDHHIVLPDARAQLLDVRLQGVFVDLAFVISERSSISLRPMEVVVDALGDAEEIGITGDDHPAGIHACPPRVGEQRAQHLRDAATGGR